MSASGTSPSGVNGSGFGRLTRDSAVYASGAVLGKVVALLMLPVLTRLLTPTQYGVADLLTTFGSVGISLLLLGLDTSATRLAAGADQPFPPPRVYGSWLATSSIILVVPVAAIVVYARPIGTALFGDSSDTLAVALVGLITIAGTYHFMALTILRAERRPVPFALVSGGTFVLNAVIAVLLLRWWRQDASAVVLAVALSLIIGATVGFLFIGRRGMGRPGIDPTKSLIRLGLPLAPAVAATWLAELANRLILLESNDAAEIAYLGVGLRIASVAGLVLVGFQLGWIPHAYARGTTPAALVDTGLDARRIIVLVAVSIVTVGVVSPELLTVVAGTAFAQALPSIGLSLVATLGTALFLVTSMASLLDKRMGIVSLATMLGVAAALVANLALARAFGSAGTAGALAIGQLVAAGLAAWFGRDVLRLPVPWRRVLLVVGVAIVGVLLATLPSGGASPGARILVALVFTAVAVAEGTVVDLARISVQRLRSDL